MPRVSQLYFKTAVLFLIAGIAMGLKMSISGHHDVIGAHAHANLLGWVTMALFGAYYSVSRAKAETRFALVQYGVYTIGVLIMIPALYLMLSGYPEFEPLVAAGSLISFAGILMFAFSVFSAERSVSGRTAPAEA